MRSFLLAAIAAVALAGAAQAAQTQPAAGHCVGSNGQPIKCPHAVRACKSGNICGHTCLPKGRICRTAEISSIQWAGKRRN